MHARIEFASRILRQSRHEIGYIDQFFCGSLICRRRTPAPTVYTFYNRCHHDAYTAILSSTPRIVAASLFTYFVVQQFDMRLYGFLKSKLENRFYMFRNYSSVALSQLLDTVLFSFLGLYGIVTHIWEIVLVSYAIKLAILLFTTPF